LPVLGYCFEPFISLGGVLISSKAIAVDLIHVMLREAAFPWLDLDLISNSVHLAAAPADVILFDLTLQITMK